MLARGDNVTHVSKTFGCNRYTNTFSTTGGVATDPTRHRVTCPVQKDCTVSMATYLKPTCAIFLPHTGKFLVAGLANKDLKTWHKSLKKPSFALPEWVNTPAMSTVYGCMGYGSYLVWRDCGGFQGDGVLPLSCYGANLALTWTFRPLLAKTKNLGVGAIWMVSILGATIATAVTFKQVNSKAGYLVLPYLGWLCYSNLYMFSLRSNNRVRTD